MTNKDIFNITKVVRTIPPNVMNNTTDGTGDGVDTDGYESARVDVNIGASGDTLSGSVKFIAAVQESSDDGDTDPYADIPAARLYGSTLALVDDAAEDNLLQSCGVRLVKQYLRVLITVTGTHTNGTPVAATVTLGSPRTAAVEQG